MRVELTVNGRVRAVEVEPRTSLLDCLRERLLLTGAHAGCEHGVCGACTVLIDGAPVRSCLMFAVQADGYAITTIEGVTPGPGELSPVQDAFCETHGMQCGYCTPAMILTAHALLAEQSRADPRGHRRGDFRQHLPLHRLCADRRSDCARRRAHARPEPAGGQAMSAKPFRFVSSDRRVREDRRFVVGKGRFAADIAMAGTRHVALVTCPHPAARIVAIDKAAALAMPGVHYVLDGRELAAATQPLLAGLDTPNVPRRPLAVGRGALRRRMGRGGGRRYARARRGCRRDGARRLRAAAVRARRRGGIRARQPARCTRTHGSNVLLDRTFVWGEVEKDFAESPHRLALRVEMGPQLDGADRDLRRARELGPLARRCSTSTPRSRCRAFPTRSRSRSSCRARRCACTTTSTSAAATASSAASSTRCWPAISRAGSASRCG